MIVLGIFFLVWGFSMFYPSYVPIVVLATLAVITGIVLLADAFGFTRI